MSLLRPGLIFLLAAASAGPVAAQNNPFVAPTGALTREQVAEIVRSEVAKNIATVQPGAPEAPPGSPDLAGQMTPGTAAAVQALPAQQGGAPSASVASDMAQAEEPEDVVATVLADGGEFVGCVAGTPIFKDKNGRRAYFSTKELEASNEARRYSRCS